MEERQENRLGTMSVGKLLVSMSLPLMISMFVQALYNIVDGIYVAQISEDAFTATSLAFPAQMLMTALALGLGAGANSLISRRLGAREFDGADRAAGNGITLSFITFFAVMIFGIFGSEWFISLFTDDANLISLGADYLSICATYSIGIYVSIMCERLLQATGNAAISMVTQLAGAITNIIFDPILIFGRYGFPEMGIKGAAIATVMGQIVSALLGIIFNNVKNHEIHLSLRHLALDGKTVADIYRVGVPVTILNALGSVLTVFMNMILIEFSSTAVAVFGAYYKLNSFIYMPVFGLVQGLVPIVGFNYGARKPERIMRAVKLACITAVCILTFGMVLFLTIPDKLLSIFEAGDEMLAIGCVAFRIIGIAFPFSAISIVLGNMFQGLGIGTVSLVNSFMRQIVVLLPSAYLLSHAFGLNATWYSFLISEVASLVYTVIAYKAIYTKRIKPLYNTDNNIQ